MLDYVTDISINIIAGILFGLLTFLAAKLRSVLELYRATRFFGHQIRGDDLRIVPGSFSSLDPGHRSPSKETPTCQKTYQNGATVAIRGPKLFTGIADIRAGSYVIQAISKFRKRSLSLSTDDEALTNLDQTFIALGGPVSNQITLAALRDPHNSFIDHQISDNLITKAKIFHLKLNGETKAFRPTPEYGYGYILKIRNSRFPDHYFFICAGLGDWGTSGTAWYLANKWAEIYKEFGGSEFVMVCEVTRQIDTSTVCIFKSKKVG
ncbi:MAG: hypothetical protein KDJ97_26185 [Anaerolineae bacterium]|nr:hypothetical protein [Anaerolineae bacterium]